MKGTAWIIFDNQDAHFLDQGAMRWIIFTNDNAHFFGQWQNEICDIANKEHKQTCLNDIVLS